MTCTGTDGRLLLVTRYISPQEPPVGLTTIDRVSRFVSRIPFISDNELLRASCDIWCTTEQFLELGAGDEEEHAVLLCNYLLFLQHRAYVVVGATMSATKALFVLVKEAEKWSLLNPNTGESYLVEDPHCPLKDISCVFNNENVSAASGSVHLALQPP